MKVHEILTVSSVISYFATLFAFNNALPLFGFITLSLAVTLGYWGGRTEGYSEGVQDNINNFIEDYHRQFRDILKQHIKNNK